MPELQISTDKIEDFIEAARLGSGLDAVEKTHA
jgi:hypothetical protein